MREVEGQGGAREARDAALVHNITPQLHVLSPSYQPRRRCPAPPKKKQAGFKKGSCFPLRGHSCS